MWLYFPDFVLNTQKSYIALSLFLSALDTNNVVNTSVVLNADSTQNNESVLYFKSVLNTKSILNTNSVLNTKSILNTNSVLNTKIILNSNCVLNTMSILNTNSVLNTKSILNTNSVLNNFTHRFTDKDDVKSYDIYGVTVGEVEVDLLTGQHQVSCLYVVVCWGGLYC